MTAAPDAPPGSPGLPADPPTGPPRPPRRSPWPIALLGAGLLLVAVNALVFATHPHVVGLLTRLGHASGLADSLVGAIPADPCGDPVAKASGGTWTCTFADDFDTAALDTTKWAPVATSVTGFKNGPECYVPNSKTIVQSGGVLTLSVVKTLSPFTCASPRGDFTANHVAGYVSTSGIFSQTYGRFEFRVKFPDATMTGVHSALWLWPQTALKYGAWPASGEIDVAEFYSSNPDRAIPYVHYAGDKDDANRTNTKCLVDKPAEFHTYTAEWTATSISIWYDGVLCIKDAPKPTNVTAPAPFDQPFNLNLTQGLGIAPNAFDAATTPVPASMTVDHVRVWK